jgi:hypothetical protein
LSKKTLRQGLILLAGIAAILASAAMIIGGQFIWYSIVTILVTLVTVVALTSMSAATAVLIKLGDTCFKVGDDRL